MKKLSISLLCALISTAVYSQTKLKVKEEGITINDTGSDTPQLTSVLDVESTSKGVIFPRLTLQERNNIQNPAEGLLLYNSSLHLYEFYNGTEWVAMSGASTYEVPPAPTNLSAVAINYNQVDIAWNIDSPDPLQFVIERRTLSGNYAAIATVGSGITNYTDVTGLSPNTEFYYRIKSSYGADSEYTTEASVVTPIQSITYNIGTSPGRTPGADIFTHGGNFTSYGNAMGLYPLAANQVRYMEKSYTYADNWRKWKIFAASNTTNTKAMFYDLATNQFIAEIDLVYTGNYVELTLPGSVTGDFILRIQKTSDGGAQLYQIQKFIQEGL